MHGDDFSRLGAAPGSPAEGILRELRGLFENLSKAQTFTARAAGETRVVRVTDEGDREVIGPDDT